MIPAPPDSFLIRCPKLGHQIYFSYCEREGGSFPCPKALDCWHGIFSVEEYFRERYEQEVFEGIFFAKPKPKLLTLVELIEKAKERIKK